MRISDWSSDVCSSDLLAAALPADPARFGGAVSFQHALGAHEDAAVRTDDSQDLPVALQHAPGAGPEHQGRRAGGDGGRRVDAVHHLVMGRLAAEEDGRADRKSVVEGKSVSVRVDLGVRRILKKTKSNKHPN